MKTCYNNSTAKLSELIIVAVLDTVGGVAAHLFFPPVPSLHLLPRGPVPIPKSSYRSGRALGSGKVHFELKIMPLVTKSTINH